MLASRRGLGRLTVGKPPTRDSHVLPPVIRIRDKKRPVVLLFAYTRLVVDAGRDTVFLRLHLQFS